MNKFRLRISRDFASDVEVVLHYTAENFGERKRQEYKELIRSARGTGFDVTDDDR